MVSKRFLRLLTIAIITAVNIFLKVKEVVFMPTVEYEGISFVINDSHVLTNMINCGIGKRRDISIPKQFPSGEVIKCLGFRFCVGEFGLVDVANGIRYVHSEAFAQSDVREVNWPSGCKRIPEDCFKNSNIEKITGIEKVTEIDAGAFCCTKLKELSWPHDCKIIPWGCFASSKISALSGIEGVEVIEDEAFCNSEIKELTWPDSCERIPTFCFFESAIRKLDNLKGVTSIGASAFKYTFGLEFLDFSASVISEVGECAFQTSNLCKVFPPYYCSEEIQKKFFEEV